MMKTCMWYWSGGVNKKEICSEYCNNIKELDEKQWQSYKEIIKNYMINDDAIVPNDSDQWSWPWWWEEQTCTVL